MARYKLPPQASYKKIRCRLRREGLTLNTRFGELYTMKRCEKYDAIRSDCVCGHVMPIILSIRLPVRRLFPIISEGRNKSDV